MYGTNVLLDFLNLLIKESYVYSSSASTKYQVTLTLNWNGLDSKDWTFSSVTLYSVIFLTRPIIHSFILGLFSFQK